MENAWNEYSRLEKDVDWLKSALQGQMNRSDLSQVCGSVISVNKHKSQTLVDGCVNEIQAEQRFLCGYLFRGMCVNFKLKKTYLGNMDDFSSLIYCLGKQLILRCLSKKLCLCICM